MSSGTAALFIELSVFRFDPPCGKELIAPIIPSDTKMGTKKTSVQPNSMQSSFADLWAMAAADEHL
jgi:hypothetical protein